MTLYVMFGIPGSGKTTKSIQLAKELGAKLYSYDVIKRDLWSSSFNDVCAVIYQSIKNDLLSGCDVIYDAPHTKLVNRKDLLSNLADIRCNKILICMDTPFEECIRRNSRRSPRLPDKLIEDMHESTDSPTIDEGWDEIIYVKEDGSYEKCPTGD